jgi:hypothetical protein
MQVGDAELGRIVLRIASRYARFIQARFGTTGHLFERRYHAVLVDEDEYLVTLLRYIHQNPLKAGIVSSLRNYRWSSHHAYMGTRRQSWVTTDFALRLLGSTHDVSRHAYRRLVEELVSDDEILPHPDDKRILGDDRFLKRYRQAGVPPPKRTLQELVSEACVKFSLDLERLQSPSKERIATAARAWLAHQAVGSRSATICEVARCLKRHEASIRGLMRRHPAD